MSEQAAEDGRKRNVPVAPETHRQLLTIQLERKVAGLPWSFDDIIKGLLAGQPVQP